MAQRKEVLPEEAPQAGPVKFAINKTARAAPGAARAVLFILHLTCSEEPDFEPAKNAAGAAAYINRYKKLKDKLV